MARFTRYNNPNRRRASKASTYSQAYVEERREEMYRLLAQAGTSNERDLIADAFKISVK